MYTGFFYVFAFSLKFIYYFVLYFTCLVALRFFEVFLQRQVFFNLSVWADFQMSLCKTRLGTFYLGVFCLTCTDYT